MTPEELNKFLLKYGIANDEFASMMHVTNNCVKFWLLGTREISPLNAKFIRFLDAGGPQRIQEFAQCQ